VEFSEKLLRLGAAGIYQVTLLKMIHDVVEQGIVK